MKARPLFVNSILVEKFNRGQNESPRAIWGPRHIRFNHDINRQSQAQVTRVWLPTKPGFETVSESVFENFAWPSMKKKSRLTAQSCWTQNDIAYP